MDNIDRKKATKIKRINANLITIGTATAIATTIKAYLAIFQIPNLNMGR